MSWQIAELTLNIPREWWLSSNDRRHWRNKAARVKTIRDYANARAYAQRFPKLETASLICEIAYPKGTSRADAHNAQPTVKAIIDGLIDYGFLPDDDSKHLTSVTFTQVANLDRRSDHQITIRATT